MSNDNNHIVDELAQTIQLLADVWPNDRENVAIAGAKFESVIESFDQSFGQTQKLANLAWKGIKHLYEHDTFFMEVKATTMQAINLFREFIVTDGDIKVEDFEKAFAELSKALNGGKESADSIISEEELEELESNESAKAESDEQDNSEVAPSSEEATVADPEPLKEEQIVAEVAGIIQLLADVWPNDRDNVAVAGAKFEQVVSSLESISGQMQKLSDIAYQGIIHLYQKDEYFITVKATTMQAINVFREFLLPDVDVSVEAFEKAYEELENALSGNGESADKVITDEEIEAYSAKEVSETPEANAGVEVPKDATLDDLATHLLMMDDSSAKEDVELLAGYLLNSAASEMDEATSELKKAYTIVERILSADQREDGWLETVSAHIEKASEIISNQEWEDSQVDEASEAIQKAPTAEPNPEPVAVEKSKDELTAEKEKNKPSTEVFLIPEDIDLSMVGEFITECSELIDAAESALLDLEDHPDDNELVNTVFRAFHTIKGTSAFMGLDPITEFTHHVETVLSIVRDGDLPFDRACADINFESIDIIKKLLGTVEHCNGGDPLPVPVNYQSMMNVLVDVADNKVPPAEALSKEESAVRPIANEAEVASGSNEEARVDAPASTSVQAAKTENEAQNEQGNQAQKGDSESSVRVSVNRLDRLIDMVGELVIAHSVVAQDPNISKDSELQKKVNHATKILRELQDTSLTLRMVPLKATFHKMNRLVRDLSRKAGKQVKFNTVGEDTEIDRNMVDIINEPLIHMLRNSLDHGIETNEQRAQTDKPEVATVTLRAYQEGGKVVLQIQDDGRGINKEVILRKALEKGLIDPDKKLTDSEIYGLIFLPGFSSAEKVTDLSGRGVGMDVVRRSIEQLQGKVEVTSELGVGTTITIELPFTLAITDGMLIRVGQERFIVPTINIDMTFRANPEDLFTVLGENEQVSFRGKSVPVIRLHRLFEIDEAIEDIMSGTLLVIKNNNDRFALLVDEVIGQQQLVGKSINMIAPTQHISGGAILGDGRVGLILDTAALTA
jgi:two-component system chemotaxis sensor kinase CheA